MEQLLGPQPILFGPQEVKNPNMSTVKINFFTWILDF